MSGQESLLEARPSTLLEHLDHASEGRVKVQRLADVLMSGSAWQFIHRTAADGPYHVKHVREECDLCDLIDWIWRCVGDYQGLVRSFFVAAEETAAQAARERAEQELTARITVETREYLLSKPEFEAIA